MYVRKEAVLSSMIEGTQSSLSDLLLHELKHQPGVPLDDVREVSNYVAALNYGVDRINRVKRISGSPDLIHRALLERPMATPKLIQAKRPAKAGIAIPFSEMV